MRFHKRTWECNKTLQSTIGGFESQGNRMKCLNKPIKINAKNSKETASVLLPTEEQQISNFDDPTNDNRIEDSAPVSVDNFDYNSENDSFMIESISSPVSPEPRHSIQNAFHVNPFSRMYVSERSTEEELRLEQVMVDMKLFTCNVCEEDVQSYPGLKSHFNKKHPKEKYKICCNITAPSTSRELYEHMKWHLNPGLFKCEVCQLKFDNKFSLNEHKIVEHQHEEICDACEEYFPLPGGLKRHVESRHPTLFKCKHCNASK